jgi:hypothetical protein
MQLYNGVAVQRNNIPFLVLFVFFPLFMGLLGLFNFSIIINAFVYILYLMKGILKKNIFDQFLVQLNLYPKCRALPIRH